MLPTVLIVDDQATVRLVLRELLQEQGFSNIKTAQNGQEALTIWHNEPINLILSDLEMPVLNGWELLKKIRLLDSQVPFIIISSLQNPTTKQQLTTLGATAYLTKPFNISDLQNLLGQFVISK